ANKLKSELKSLKESEINELRNIFIENQKLQSQIETLSIENKELKSMLDELSQEAEANLNQRKKLNVKIKELENQIEKEKSSFRLKEEEYNKALKETTETNAKQAHEFTKLKKSYNERLNNLEELSTKKDAKIKNLKENVKIFLKNEATLKNALLNHETQMKSIANTIANDFKANFIKLKDQYTHIKNQLIIKENKIVSLQKELQEKEALLVDKENSLEKTNAILNENNELKTQIEALKVEEEALKKKVYNDQFELRSYKEKATYMENKLVALKADFDKTNKDCINTVSGMFKEIGKPQLAVPYNYFSLVEMIEALLNELRDQMARMLQKLNSAESALTSETQTFQEKLESLLQDNALNGYAAKLKRELEGRNEIINQVNQRAEADINEIKAKYEAYMQKMIYIIGKDNDSALASVLKELELYKREYNNLKDKIKNRKRNQQQKEVKESPQSPKITESDIPQ
ncbi:hypothetical protein ROZALSC1DRAFT_28053, partial [Rozella allomycis CSF55]